MDAVRRVIDSRQKRWALLACFVVGGFAVPALAADNVWSVQKLNDNKPWDRFADSVIRVEGRIGSSGGSLFRMLHCEANFKVDAAKLKFVPAKSVVEVKGRFKKDGTKVDFFVDELKVMSNYPEQYDVRASKLKRPMPEEWIELGEWAAEKSKFYEDEEMAKKAADAYSNAIEVEYRALKLTDAEGRFSLAKKFDEYKLPPRRKMDLIHEGLRIQWQAAQKVQPTDLAAWRIVAASVHEQLPGANEPLKTVAPELKESYEQDPVSTYRAADDKLRLRLNRLFFVGVTRKILMNDAGNEGAYGDSIADQIDKLIPEEHALAEKQRELRLAYRLAHVSTATRTEVENLATLFRERRQNESAQQALVQWVKSHEVRLKDGGIIGLMQLADEYHLLLKDEPTAVDYLSQAYKIDPTYEDVKAKLASMGYQYQNSRWIKSNGNHREQSAAVVASPTSIRMGMTATDLRLFLGQPPSLARIVTKRGITEIWSFGVPGSSGLVIRLEQKSLDPEPKVSAMSGQ